MVLILKRGTEYTPIIFQHETLVNKKCVTLVEGDGRKLQTIDGFQLNEDITTLDYHNVYISRNHLLYYNFGGGLIKANKMDILSLIVTNNSNEKFVIVNKYFSEVYTSYFTRLKKSIKALKINKKNILIWEDNQIYKEFMEMINPTMEDYIPSVQEELSKRFLESMKSNISIS